MASRDRRSPPGLTVGDLLRTEELKAAVVIGGESGLHRPVDGVDVLSAAYGLSGARSRHLVVGSLRGRPPFELDLLLRQAHDANASGVVLVDAGRYILSTRRLADRLSLPTVSLVEGDPLALAWRLAELIEDPVRRGWQLLAGGLTAIENAAWDPADLVSAVGRALDAQAALIAADGTVLAGGDLGIEATHLAVASRRVVLANDHQVVLHPVSVEDRHRAELWVAVRVDHAHPDWVSASAHVAAAAAAKVSGWATRERLNSERNARERADLLAELLQSAQCGTTVLERAVRAGLRLDGWHVALYLRGGDPGGLQPAQVRHLEHTLTRELGTGPLVARPDGWVTWLTSSADPAKASYRELARQIRAIVESVRDAIDVVIGIGRPYEGPSGVGTSVREARDAVLFAGYDRRRGPVEHADELGVRRALSEWYRAEAFRTHAERILAPLLDSEDRSLLDTLGAFLDRESSTSATAAHLGVHRNTVAQRITRAEQLLEVNLARADDRLVIQLACRVLGLSGEPEAT